MDVIKQVFESLWGVQYLPQAVIVSLVLISIQFSKKKGLSKQYAPFLAVVIAVILNLINALLIGLNIDQAISEGIITGLIASGSFSNLKALNKKFN